MPLEKPDYEVIVIGGSFAGLAAAMQVARACRRVLVLDAGQPRNRFAAHSHGFLGQDGVPPAQILDAARRQLRAYSNVTFADSKADAVSAIATAGEGSGGAAVATGFRVGTHSARKLILATGLRDLLPDVPGLEPLWGGAVFNCPYCHGYEFRDRPLGVLASPVSAHHATMLADWSRDVVLFANGTDVDADTRGKLARRNVAIERTPIARLISDDNHLQAVELTDGRRVPRAALLIGPRFVQASPVAEELGCAFAETPLGNIVKVDERKMTSVPGCYAAGDLARFPHSVSLTVGDAAAAGVACHQALVAEDAG